MPEERQQLTQHWWRDRGLVNPHGHALRSANQVSWQSRLQFPVPSLCLFICAPHSILMKVTDCTTRARTRLLLNHTV